MDAAYHVHLREAQEKRNRGDYDTGDPLTAAESGEQIRRAELFLEGALEVLEGAGRTTS
jgi:hypothetical protein